MSTFQDTAGHRPAKARAWYDPATPDAPVRSRRPRKGAGTGGLAPMARLVATGAVVVAGVGAWSHFGPAHDAEAAVHPRAQDIRPAFAFPAPASVARVPARILPPAAPAVLAVPRVAAPAAVAARGTDTVATRKLAWAMTMASDGYKSLKARMSRCRTAGRDRCT